MTKTYLIIAIVSLLIGIVMHAHPVATGLGKAMFGVFFIVAFLVKLAEYWTSERPEAKHEGAAGKGGHRH